MSNIKKKRPWYGITTDFAIGDGNRENIRPRRLIIGIIGVAAAAVVAGIMLLNVEYDDLFQSVFVAAIYGLVTLSSASLVFQYSMSGPLTERAAFLALERHITKGGHPNDVFHMERRLGSWVDRRCREYLDGVIEPNLESKLEKVAEWQWDWNFARTAANLERDFEQGIQLLEKYVETYGTSLVSYRFFVGTLDDPIFSLGE